MKYSFFKYLSILSIFLILKTNTFGQSENYTHIQSGTGFAITANGYIVTNYHVVYISSLKKEGDYFEIAQTINGETIKYKAKIVSSDPVNDLVILKIIDGNFKSFGTPPFTIKFQTVEKGSDVFTMGFPRTDIQGVETKVTKGNIVAQTGFDGEVGHYTISAPFDHGSSGGPLFDNDGNIIGVTDIGLSIENSKMFNEKTPLSTSQFYALKASKIAPMLDLLTDVQLPIQNTILNLPFTKKVKALEKFVFIINTYTIDDNKKQNTSQPKEDQISNNENRKMNPNLNIGTKVHVKRHGYDKMGIISNKIITEKGYVYTITYKVGRTISVNVNASELTIIERNGKIVNVSIKL